MGVNAAKIGEDQDVRGHASVFRRHTELREDLFAKSAEGLFLDDVFLGHRNAPSCTTTNKGFVYKFADATTARRGLLLRYDHDAARHLGEEAIECLMLSLTVLRVLEDVGPERSEEEDAEPVRALVVQAVQVRINGGSELLLEVRLKFRGRPRDLPIGVAGQSDLHRAVGFEDGLRALPGPPGLAFCRNSRRNAFGARSVATVIVTGGRPSAWWRRKASVRRRSFFQHSRNQVPTARCTQNSSSYSSFSRSWSGLSSSPARTNRWSAYVDARRRQMFFARVHRRRSRNREGFANTSPAIGPEASASLNAQPGAESSHPSASLHESSLRGFSYRPRRRIASDFSSYTGSDQRAEARAFSSAAVNRPCSFAKPATMARIVGTVRPRTGTGEPT